jgi:hypothetical protein
LLIFSSSIFASFFDDFFGAVNLSDHSNIYTGLVMHLTFLTHSTFCINLTILANPTPFHFLNHAPFDPKVSWKWNGKAYVIVEN